MKRELTCIICPLGCSLVAELEDGQVTAVKGNTCPRGAVYAREECTNPKRTVTSTVRCKDGSMVSVKTDGTIPKEKMAECMDAINHVILDLPVSVGDVIIEDIFGCNVVATQNKRV
ncbi:MAG: DUF1667 domain-containing protein [Clostridia bacterium]|nr:DUF1667 domain-containing protein [Clostridia bacterium]